LHEHSWPPSGSSCSSGPDERRIECGRWLAGAGICECRNDSLHRRRRVIEAVQGLDASREWRWRIALGLQRKRWALIGRALGQVSCKVLKPTYIAGLKLEQEPRQIRDSFRGGRPAEAVAGQDDVGPQRDFMHLGDLPLATAPPRVPS
jgi:hypothetical protein